MSRQQDFLRQGNQIGLHSRPHLSRQLIRPLPDPFLHHVSQSRIPYQIRTDFTKSLQRKLDEEKRWFRILAPDHGIKTCETAIRWCLVLLILFILLLSLASSYLKYRVRSVFVSLSGMGFAARAIGTIVDFVVHSKSLQNGRIPAARPQDRKSHLLEGPWQHYPDRFTFDPVDHSTHSTA